MDTNPAEPEQQPVRVEIHPLTGLDYAKEIGRGVGVTMGLSLLWGLEIVRDGIFRVLDSLNVRPRHKRASAFPPGKPRKRPAA